MKDSSLSGAVFYYRVIIYSTLTNTYYCGVTSEMPPSVGMT